jgi:hypothetical protein
MSILASHAENGAHGSPLDVDPRTRRRSIPPHAYFVGSAIFHYLGPSFAVLLFARVGPLGVAWPRIASAAVVFAAWRQPWARLRGLDRRGWLLIAGLGAVFAVMNACFYEAIGCRWRWSRRSSSSARSRSPRASAWASRPR